MTPIYALLHEKPMSISQLWPHFPGHTFIELQDKVEKLVADGLVDFRFDTEIVYFVKGDHGQS